MSQGFDAERTQPSPDDLGYWLASVTSALIRDWTERFRSYNISPVQFRILEMCYRNEASTVTELSRVIVLDAGGISRQVDRLFNMGLLDRIRQVHDRRSVRLELTAEGRALVPQLLQHMSASYEVVWNGIDERERAVLFDLLQRMFHNLSPEENAC